MGVRLPAPLGRAAAASLILIAAVAGSPPPATPSMPSDDARLSRARELLRGGRAQQAFEFYHALEKARPQDPEVRMGLAESAILVGDKSTAHRLVDAGIAEDGTNPDWIRLHGMLLASEGKKEEALAAWRRLLEVIPDREAAYRITAGLIASEKMLPEATALLIDGRRALRDSLLFGEELAPLYDLMGKPDDAILELARALAGMRITAMTAMTRSPSLEGAGVNVAAAAESVRALAASYPARVELLDYLAWLRLAAGDCAGASAAATEADRVSGLCSEHRMALFGMVRPDAPCEAAALGMLREVLTTCPPVPRQWSAVMALTDRLVEAGEYSEARDLLRQTLDRAPEKTRDTEAGRLRLGDVLLDGTREPAKAQEVFKAIQASCSRCPSSWPARLGAARSALLLGDFGAAESAYREAVERGPDDETREAALFGLCEVGFFSGAFDKAGEGLKQLITTYPKGRLLNDAVERMVFLSENTDAGEGLLKSYADALRIGLSGNAPGAIERFNAITADFPLSNLRDDAFMQVALLTAWTGADEDALAKLEGIVTDFPQSPLAPRAILERARIRWRRLGDVAGAREECERLLLHYSDSLLADEARSLGERLGRVAQAETQG